MKECCTKCGNENFAIARDMKATRLCKCGNSWLPGGQSFEVAKPGPIPKKQLTDWEAGNELVAICDEIDRRSIDLRTSHPHLHRLLKDCRKAIACEFNAMKAHGFGL